MGIPHNMIYTMEEKKQPYLFGINPVHEAIKTGRKFEKILFKQGLEGDKFRALLDLVKQNEIPFQFVPGEKMNKLYRGAHQGVIGYMSQIDYLPFEDVVEKALAVSSAPIFLMLDGVSDVRNFGAIVRSAECAGVSGVILPAKGGAAINADAIKTSSGALLRVPVCKVPNLRIPLYWLIDAGFHVVGATEKAGCSIYDVDLTQPTVIVMGSEGKGISDSVLSLCNVKAAIPMLGQIGSLNVSVATAIVLFEAVRQRMPKI
jgi:23S rRNA (guanosine2251-2'-O)-methyltransferase